MNLIFISSDGEWRAAEGIGLTFGFTRQFTDNLGSGRVESYSPYLFRPAKVEVFGSTSQGKTHILQIYHNFNFLFFISSSYFYIHKC